MFLILEGLQVSEAKRISTFRALQIVGRLDPASAVQQLEFLNIIQVQMTCPSPAQRQYQAGWHSACSIIEPHAGPIRAVFKTPCI